MYFLVINRDLRLQARARLTRPETLEASLPRRHSLILSFCSGNTNFPPPPPAGSLIQCVTSRQSFKSLQAKFQPLRVQPVTDELHMQQQDGLPWETHAAVVRLQGSARAVVIRGKEGDYFCSPTRRRTFRADQQPQRALCAAKEEVIITQAVFTICFSA